MVKIVYGSRYVSIPDFDDGSFTRLDVRSHMALLVVFYLEPRTSMICASARDRECLVEQLLQQRDLSHFKHVLLALNNCTVTGMLALKILQDAPSCIMTMILKDVKFDSKNMDMSQHPITIYSGSMFREYASVLPISNVTLIALEPEKILWIDLHDVERIMLDQIVHLSIIREVVIDETIFYRMKKLKSLSIVENSQYTLDGVKWNGQLTELTIRDTTVSNKIISQLFCQHLQTLEFTGSGVWSVEFPIGVTNLTVDSEFDGESLYWFHKLESIYVVGTNTTVDFAFVRDTSPITRTLRKIDAGFCPIHDGALRHFRKLEYIKIFAREAKLSFLESDRFHPLCHTLRHITMPNVSQQVREHLFVLDDNSGAQSSDSEWETYDM